MLKEKSKHSSEKLGYKDFKSNNGWIENIKNRQSENSAVTASIARLGIFLIQIPTTVFEKKNKTILIGKTI